jgi:type I restriction enzyme S subunit
MENTNLKPVLRFPEFTEDWSPEIFGNPEITSFFKGKGISKADIYEDGANKCIRYGELYTLYNEVIDEVSSKTNLPLNDLFLSKANDVIIPASGETQLDIATASCVLHDNIALSGDLNVLRSTINGIFLSYYLNNKKKKEIARLSQGSSVIHLYNPHLKSLKLNLPKPLEQQKIATFLTSIDSRITLLKEKEDALIDFKKGVLQKIFNQDIRFKDDNGNDFSDWAESKFDDYYEFKNTNSFSRENLNYESGVVKNIHYGDIHTKFSTHFNIKKEELPFINQDINIDRIDEENYVQNGDLVMADASEDYADIGKTIEIMNTNGEKILAGLHTFLARKTEKTLALGFFGHLLTTYNTRLKLMKIAQGTKVLGLSKGRVEKITLYIPTSKEQIKITNYLTALDNKIDALERKIEASVDFKKGLLQQLFV